MDERALLPALRGVDIIPFRREDGAAMFALRDNSGLAPRPLAVTLPGYFILAHLNGENCVADVQAAFVKQFGAHISGAQIGELVAALDEALFLDTERSQRAYAAMDEAYQRADARDNRSRWQSADELLKETSPLIHGPQETVRGLRGVIAPHLDYARGGTCYGPAYSLLRQHPAERYVILGTNHFGRSRSVVATRKDFVTPLGRVETDRRFIDSIETALGQSICGRELDHDAEHSVELQVHLLQACFPERAFSIVPVLCPDPSGATGTRPADGRGPDLGAFADAVSDYIAADSRSTVLIAGADFSHIGQRFGDEKPTTGEFLTQVSDYDRGLLDLLAARREEEFVARVREAQNPTRICSVGCVYALLRALPEARCEILRYHQAIDMAAETHVTCAAAVLTQAEN
jgi:AmmeMemoRadiSam system protein B